MTDTPDPQFFSYDEMGQYLDMMAESCEISHDEREDLEVTPALVAAFVEFENEAEKVLLEVLPGHPGFVCEDPQEFITDENIYLVLMTLRGEGVGIWDGRCDHYFEKPSENIPPLEKILKARLVHLVEETGTGKLNDALMECSFETTGNGDQLSDPEPA